MNDVKHGSAVPEIMARPAPKTRKEPVPPNMQIDRVVEMLSKPGEGVDPDLQRKILIVAKHLHAMLDELEVGEPEILKVYEFLDRVGANGDMMLLGDHFGLSVRANDISYLQSRGTVPNVIGPLYREDAPFMDNPGQMVADDEPGRHIILSGQVRDCDTGKPLPGTILDFWQSNHEGFYEDQRPDMPDYEFRRRIKADDQGRYSFRTIVPGGYYIANRDTPVVELTKAVGLGSFRPPHIHLMVDAPGFTHLTTLIYFEGEPSNEHDSIFSFRVENMARIKAPAQPGTPETCEFDIELIRED
ncbi:dioxygenase [Psychromarinibacter halotolerans]|uniref:Dioxygenase n=1 Tax=Psychromarinibacter halotolerans TaxID=1775175 RepID=A0ABV7GXF2_9RHOB|nr:dioxygenase [Psychromarinibacter halotolerans]MDF0597641.1 dioxygenase [Psychromarinibacter halotolerans]